MSFFCGWFSLKFWLKSHHFALYWSKNNQEQDLPCKKKMLVFLENKIVILLWVVFPRIFSEISTFALFLFKNNQTNTMCIPFKKTVTFCENSRSVYGWFSLNFCLKSQLLPFLFVKKLKKHYAPFKKTVTFRKNCRSFWGWFSLKLCLKFRLLPFFCQKQLRKET